MSKVVKAGQAQPGEAVVVTARPVAGELDTVLGDAGEALSAVLAGTGSSDDPLLSDAERRAQQILELSAQQAQHALSTAQGQARQAIADGKAQAAELVRAATAELEEQRAALERELRAQLEGEYSQRYLAAVTALEGAAQELRTGQEQYLAQIEQPAYQLVLAIARQLTGAELSRNPEFIAALIAKAFKLLQPEQVVFVGVNPHSFQQLVIDDLLATALSAAGIKPERVELEIEEALQPGQFVLRLGGMRLDYSLTAALDELLAHLEQRAASGL